MRGRSPRLLCLFCLSDHQASNRPGLLKSQMRNRATCGDSFGICKYTQRRANNFAFYQTVGANSCSGKVEGRNIRPPLTIRNVPLENRINGSEHLGPVHRMMAYFSFLPRDFGIRSVCCLSFSKYCLSESSTQLKSFMFPDLNTR